jgi:hypothetical protein
VFHICGKPWYISQEGSQRWGESLDMQALIWSPVQNRKRFIA